jgi:RNA polymerase sigma-70 factor (ECF subfamily)
LYGKNDGQMIEPPDFFHPGVKMENKENAAVLFKAVNQLPANQKTAFILNKTENLSYREIAEVMESTESAVDALLQRAKKNLQKNLKDYYQKMDQQ